MAHAATNEYANTKDILHVTKMLGHKSIQNTLFYTHLIDFEDDSYKVPKDIKEACQLTESGF